MDGRGKRAKSLVLDLCQFRESLLRVQRFLTLEAVPPSCTLPTSLYWCWCVSSVGFCAVETAEPTRSGVDYTFVRVRVEGRGGVRRVSQEIPFRHRRLS